MYFAATGNMNVVGYKAYMVAFETKKMRDEFVESENMFNAITAKEAKNYDQENKCRKSKNEIYDLNNKFIGYVCYTYGGWINTKWF